MESTFNIKETLRNFKRRLPMILIMTLLFIVLSGVVSYTLMKPIYQASTQILINQNGTTAEFNTQNIDANIQLISTYNVIIKSPAILSGVIEELKLNETVKTLNEQITVSSTEDSQVVTIDVEDPSMERAVLIANTTASVFKEEIQNLMKVDNVNILAAAEMPVTPEPIKPDPLLNMAIGAVVGFMLGAGLSILLDQLNTTIRTEEDIEEIPGLQVLGIVSPVKDDKKAKKPSVYIQKREMMENVEKDKIQSVSTTKIGGTY
ncbi:Wzz/FepE/Etk N-terminal domain-containing protein [Planococcus sp. N028]|uniref:Wzz/FepE/Etk N-terminal domain-containing protein n=1 Tax=Planococcus shixiaomingii TaxID=3058393 RepID=A0ABT8N1N3_9BACL|nr:Wzz/FepE/Etk N-terminal domain-containing protein [Planococcus sp. N028]MDN7241582.1 Wzz/FepE/Etk N-terminal domain-containing protein [Planococcus sp. N028]